MLLSMLRIPRGIAFIYGGMKMEWIQEAEQDLEHLKEVRAMIHRHPEPGNREVQTAETIEREMHACGIETFRPLETAVVGTLEGKRPGKCVALRADMDALPITEETGCPSASEVPGMMHACGHDFHMAAAIGAARLLSRHRDELAGTVRFLFQPDEEGNGGAQRMIRAGVLDEPYTDAVFGMHVSPELPAGTAGFRSGKFYAASNTFELAIHGKSCHGAQPEKGVSALLAAAEAVQTAEALRKQLEERFGRVVISFGILQAGTASNIIPDRAEVHGIIRTLGPEARREVLSAFRSAIEETCERLGAPADVELYESYPGIVNPEWETAFAEASALRQLGKDRIVRIAEPTMTTEDFGFFVQERPGSFWHFGVGGEHPLHNSRFYPADALLPTAAALHAGMLYDYLMEEK